MSTQTKLVPFEMFEALYFNHLLDTDRPSCYVAYLRSESDMIRDFGAKRHANYQSFRTILWRFRRRQKQARKTRKR